ncbi:MAG: ATP-binding cassette domain-containing protein [Alicyclobacillus sp.]|nr:ATP-binding cassette domain-containing protein [Alicyclobacillus sp.]
MQTTMPRSEQAAAVPARPLLALHGVSIQYPDAGAPSVSDVNLAIAPGECVLLLGPSGCGKSTLGLACAGLIPSSVEAEVSGQIWRAGDLQAPGRVAIVFQDPETQFCMLRVDDEIAFGLENRCVPREDMPDRILASLAEAGLAVNPAVAHSTFSGGMKQKLAIAAALATDAQLLILDEPTANLDPASTRQVFDTIARLKAQGKTLLVIEHKFAALLPVADRVVMMDHTGRIRRVGTPEAVLEEAWPWMVAEGILPAWQVRPSAGPTALGTDSVPDVTARAAVAAEEVRTADRSQPVADAAPLVTVTGATLAYGTDTVWRDVSFALPRGSFTAIVGPNGAGKSSLLQALAGLQPLAAGQVELAGRPVGAWKPADRFRKLAYCFQNPEYQFVFERVGDELANRVVADDVPAEVLALLAEFGLDGTAQQSPYGLSQGQKRRLSVASMLRVDHDLYLLDEPTFGQDARTQEAIMDHLLRLQQAGKTLVMTTHDMELVRRYATHVAVLAEGRLLFWGHPSDLLKQPEVLRRAHLLDDAAAVIHEASASATPEGRASVGSASKELESASAVPRQRSTPAAALNPGLHLMTSVAAAVIAMFAHTLASAVAVCCLPLLLALAVGWIHPWRLAKRISAFVAFYVLYVWSFVAFSAVPPGAAHLRVLWWNLSWVGLHNGLVLAFRMLGVVGWGILLVSTADLTELLVSLCKNFHLSPMLSYGVLAGTRFAPMFRSEWRKLHQARVIRGREARTALRSVTYALPLFSQAVRMSERVATAMEARGFVGPAARRPDGRSYYRRVRVGAWDVCYTALAVLLSLVAVIWGNQVG